MSKRFLLLALLILAAGCTKTPERRITGVEILAFEPDLQEVTQGNDVRLMMEVQNVGDSDAEDVEALIFKCGDLTMDGNPCPAPKYLIGDLAGADISSNLPGETAVRIFTASTAGVNTVQNERVDQEVGLKVLYQYVSGATAEVPVLSEQRYKELQRDGRLPEAKIDTAFAPLNVRVTSPPQAVGSADITLEIEVEKQIDGYPESAACGAGNEVGCVDEVKITISGSGLTKQNCPDQSGFNLWRTGKNKFNCVLRPSCPEGECYPVVKVVANYTYVAEGTTKITVKRT